MSLVIWFLARRYRCAHLLFILILGITYTSLYADNILSWKLPKIWEEHPITLTGKIHSLPTEEKGIKHFIFKLKDANTLVRVSWKTSQSILVGETYQLPLKLKRIHGTQNPGSFDLEAWALQKGMRATGTVLSTGTAIKLHHQEGEWTNHLRQIIYDRALSSLPETKTAPWLIALMIGERSEVNQEDWQVLRNTGTNHLMAIGGLHIGMIGGVFCVVIAWCWRRFPALLLFMPARNAGYLAGFFIACIYALLSGFAIPAERACLMLAIAVFAVILNRQISILQIWSTALLVSLLINPLIVLEDSFWLSFGTIAIIIYGMSGRLSPTGWWWKWGRVQWVVGIGLTPLTLLLFQQLSLISFLANSIAIPWLCFCILPFCFLATIFLFINSSIASWLLWIAGISLQGLWWVLTQLSQLPFAVWVSAIPHPLIELFLIISFILFLMPSGMRGRWLGLIFLLPLFSYHIEKPTQGEVWMTLLDVGQGLSAVVQTKKHLLVFDAGPALGKINMGERVVLPYLRMQKCRQLDMLVISHADNDHRGGANAILAEMPTRQIKTSAPEKMPSPVTSYCLAGHRWDWDGVRFEFLSPFPDTLNRGNNSSCILKISIKHKSILLTGDIEKEAEYVLLQRKYSLVGSTILVAPHHGSKTSSTASFVQAVHPDFVLYATGYKNRYYFPHESVIAEYQKIHAVQLNTKDTGSILCKLKEGGVDVSPYRLNKQRYWQD